MCGSFFSEFILSVLFQSWPCLPHKSSMTFHHFSNLGCILPRNICNELGSPFCSANKTLARQQGHISLLFLWSIQFVTGHVQLDVASQLDFSTCMLKRRLQIFTSLLLITYFHLNSDKHRIL
jgi:hypothetical protein